LAIKLNSKERVIRAINGYKVDRPPFICPGGMMNIITTDIMEHVGCFWPKAHEDSKSLALLATGVSDLTGLENLGVPFCMTVEAEEMGAQVNLGRVGNEPMIESYPLENIEDYISLKPIKKETGRVKVVTDAIGHLLNKNPEIVPSRVFIQV